MAGQNPVKDPAAGAAQGQGDAGDATLSRTRIVSRPSLRAAAAPGRVEREAASVLLVDDDPSVLRAVGRSLRSRGYAVVTAQNGEEATRQIAGNTFDVILSDIGMPGINGIQLLREVRELLAIDA